MVLVRRLRSQSGHLLYVIFLVGKERLGRYVLDLVHDRYGRWLVDVWAEL